jgi:hypothetical protein
MLELALALATIVRRVRVESLSPSFEMGTPFTTVAAAPVMARIGERPAVTPPRNPR